MLLMKDILDEKDIHLRAKNTDMEFPLSKEEKNYLGEYDKQEAEGAFVDLETLNGIKLRISLGNGNTYNIEEFSKGVRSFICQNVNILDVEKELTQNYPYLL